MLEISSTFLFFVISYMIDCRLFKKILSFKKKIFTIRNVILIIFMSITSVFLSVAYDPIVKQILYNVQCCILMKIIYDKPVVNIIIFNSIVLIAVSISEMLFSAIVSLTGNNVLDLISSFFGMWLSNVVVMSTYYLFFCINKVRDNARKVITFYSEGLKLELILISMCVVLLISAVTYPMISDNYSFNEKVIVGLVFIALIYFIMNFFYQRSKNVELRKSYDYLLDYVKEYEKALEEKSKAQHEYKNQLSVIRGMSNKNNKKLHKYIDDMLEVEENKESHILNSLKPLPTGGLKGLIYYKTASMLKKDMEVHVNVDSILENDKYWDLCEKNLHNISTIVGVYLDNAIEAAEKAEKKFVIIDIDADEENIIFSFSNTYEGHIEVGKMDKQGYSTKGKSRGYGLSLVQDILGKSNYLTQEREINGIFYVQKLIIQNKK